MKILGYTDSKNTCDCGKTGLKGVFVVETEQGEILNLGSSCVKKNWDLTQKEFTSKVNKAKEERRQERIIFMKPFENALNDFKKLYPNVSKYTPNHKEYNNFMILFNNVKKGRIKLNKNFPLIITK
tara:strand:+ start:20688 stop:21065 length:378 start_codon:yes stop_codon:yes gene_type:complete